MAVSILRRISARFRRSTPSTDAGGKGLDEAAARLQELRGDKISTTLVLLLVVVASGCSSGDPEIAQDVTEDIVDNAYVEAFSRSQIPEGEERLAMAAEFQSCLESAGVEGPVTYDSENPYQPATLADAQTKLGYELGDPTVVGDPRFSAALTCLADFELLFPHRFEDHEDSFWSYIPGL